MNQRINDIIDRIRELEIEMEGEIAQAARLQRQQMKGRLAEFQRDVSEQHRRLRLGVVTFLRTSSLRAILTTPVIWSLLPLLLLVDLWVTAYQHICFRAYGMALVRRGDHVVLDRHRLAYLNRIEALNCLYCSYANGVIAYAREIAGRTEQYWCPIKHALRVRDPHSRYRGFLEYGDAEGYRSRLEEFRDKAREL